MSILFSNSSSLILPTMASTVAAQVIGMVWYGPLFGNTWMQAMKEEKPSFTADGKGNASRYLGAAVTWQISSIMFSSLVSMAGSKENLPDLLKLAWVAWLGFSVPGHVFAVIFAEHNKTASVIAASYALTVYISFAFCHWLL
jgi:Protein of unknown function (DUF1761)